MKRPLVIIASLILFNPAFLSAQYNVKEFGAKGDGVTLDTRSIQLAIDKADEHKGGVVDVPAGTYLIGTLILKDNINLNLQAGAILLGSPDYRDYTAVNQKMESRTKDLYAKYFMLFAEEAAHISITGSGKIFGNGQKNFQQVRPQNQRPGMIRLVNCENITIQGVYLLEAANWTLHLLSCRDVNIEGIVIENSGRGNRDGLDIDACQRVTVSNSRFSTTDDAIVLKSTNDLICEDIAVTNCIIRTTGSAIKTGTESNGGFKNIVVSNCIFKDIPNHAGIELMTVDGGILQNLLLENITMENVNTPIFIRIGLRARPYKVGQYISKIEAVKDIHLNNISVIDAKLPSSIMGLHSNKIKNVTVTNYTVRYTGLQAFIPYNKVPFEEFSYPMAVMFKNLPAYGLYCRNVEGLHLRNVSMYSTDQENRPALTFDRVNNLELFSIQAEVKNPATPMVHLRNIKNATAAFCRSIGLNKALFEAESSTCSNLHLYNNILRENQKEVVRVQALADESIYEDFETDSKYSVDQGESILGLKAYDFRQGSLKINMNIVKKGRVQLCLLMLNDSAKPLKIFIKYDGLVQEFLIDWKEWGWAPVTLLKELKKNQPVTFEIIPEKQGMHLKIAKAYLIYQDAEITD